MAGSFRMIGHLTDFKIIDLSLVDNEESTESIIFDLQVVVLKVQKKFDTG